MTSVTVVSLHWVLFKQDREKSHCTGAVYTQAHVQTSAVLVHVFICNSAVPSRHYCNININCSQQLWFPSWAMWSQFCCRSLCILVILVFCQSPCMKFFCKWWSLEIYWGLFWSQPCFLPTFFFFPIGIILLLIPVVHIVMFLSEWIRRDGFWISEHTEHQRSSVEMFTVSQPNVPAQYYIK